MRVFVPGFGYRRVESDDEYRYRLPQEAVTLAGVDLDHFARSRKLGCRLLLLENDESPRPVRAQGRREGYATLEEHISRSEP